MTLKMLKPPHKNKTLQLSVIIVSWNVCALLKSCLQSLEAALQGIESEVIVLDNASEDQSAQMVRQEFPWVRFVQESSNLGFGKACNHGLQISEGDYVLFLNPDTELKESCLHVMLAAMNKDSQLGFVGPKVLSSDGSFQKACRRNIPTAKTALYQMLALNKLFPQSPRFNAYHAGNLPEDQEGPVEAISGSCMLVRKEAIGQGFDERYFMYAEDLDLCLSIRQKGYLGRYLPQAEVTHHHRQSSQKSPYKTAWRFYYSAWLFHQKHYAKQTFFLLNVLIALGLSLKTLQVVILRMVRR